MNYLKRFQNLVRSLNGEKVLLLPATFVLTAGLAAALMFFLTIQATDWVSHTLEVRLAASNLLRLAQEGEAGVRGYLLTGQERFLEPYKKAAAECVPALAKLQQLTRDNAAQQSRLDQLAPLVTAMLDFLGRMVALGQRGQHGEAAAEALPSQGVMDEIGALMAQFSAAEKKLLATRERQEEWVRTILLLLILAGITSALILTNAALRSQRSLIKQLQDEAAKREKTEATLRQAQKMEAVGQLTGGVAHDFNNILTIILGNLDTIRRRLSNAGPDASAPLVRPLDDAIQGAKSAAKLIHRLLAFSRLQPLDPVPLDLNKAVAGMSDLLARTVGSPVTIETVLAGGLWLTLADTNQLENALVNLIVNAKDAMPEGGKITIETANSYLDEAYATRFGDVKPGQYVVLSVTDTGTGIAPGVLERVFEPFFTTKQPGMGTGLGLSMVHGFVKQSGGHIRIYSEAGHGTTVKVYLPRLIQADKAATPKARDVGPEPLAKAKGFETILVVEDNEGVLDFACSTLEDLGYRVITAREGHSALQHLEGDRQIDLLFTDVVLTDGMNGRQLAKIVKAQRPALPVLFTTGYSRNAIVHQGRLDGDVNLLSKPYTQLELAQRIREILDRQDTC